jgi:hypothetical protein
MSFWNGHHWGAQSPPAADVKRDARAKHVAKALLEAGLITSLTFGLIAGGAFAAKGGGASRTSGTTVSVVLVQDVNANGQVDYGDTLTFTSPTTAAYPEVGLRCWQGATWVFDGYVSLYDSWLSKNLTLESDKWNTSVPANCTARLFTRNRRGGENVLATTSFWV